MSNHSSNKYITSQIKTKHYLRAETREASLKMLIIIINTLNSLEAAEIPNVSELNIAVDQAVEDFESKARARRTRRINKSEENND